MSNYPNNEFKSQKEMEENRIRYHKNRWKEMELKKEPGILNIKWKEMEQEGAWKSPKIDGRKWNRKKPENLKNKWKGMELEGTWKSQE